MSVRQVMTRILYSLNPLFAGGDGQHAETLPTEPRAVKVLRPCRFVGEKLSLETGLVKIAACDGHGATVGFETIPGLLAVKVQTENPIRNDAYVLPLADVHPPLKRFSHVFNPQIIRRQQADVVAVPARHFNGHHDVGNQQGMFKE